MTDYSKLARKITWVLFTNQSLASAGFIASATLNSIIGAKLGGNPSLAGVPSAVYLLGAAFAASNHLGQLSIVAWSSMTGTLLRSLTLLIRAARSPRRADANDIHSCVFRGAVRRSRAPVLGSCSWPDVRHQAS